MGSAAYIDGGAPSFVNCWFGGNGGDGPLLANSSDVKLIGCFFSDSQAAPRGNLRLFGGSLEATDCFFDGNASGSGDGAAAMHLMAVQSQLNIERCHWRSAGGVNVSGRALYLESCVTFIDNSTFTDFHPLDLPGGALLAADGDLSMTGVVFTRCVTEQGVGGALALVGCRAVISSCEFQANSSAPSEASGGAIYKWGHENLVVSNCLFEGNRAGEGGALHVAFGPAVVLGSFFLDNVAMVENSATLPARGGALVALGPLVVDHSAFVGNQALANVPNAIAREALGGAMYIGGPSTISDVLLHENLAAGQSLALGGAIYSDNGAAGSTLTRVQLRHNSCSAIMGGTARGGGLAGDMIASKCSFTGNQAANGGGSAWGGVLDHCILEGGTPTELGGSSLATYSLISGGYPGLGNLAGDPLFWGVDDLHLLPGSPCIDSGDPNGPADLDGTPADMGALAYDPQHCGPGCLGVISSRPCTSVPNSSGFEAHTIALGSNGVQDNMVILFSEQLPIGVPGYYLAAPQEGFVPLFGGSEGNLCLGQGIVRMNATILQVNAAGQVSRTLDLTQLPQGQTVMPGSSWHYQLWFRDFNGVQSTSNTTSSARVDFQ
ncbi:MAG: hypothetical protein JKY61_08275 [Planctomycetes bacterium]|nr:hypothetical protein [Planctomycetota bacterium]